jgi:hypothetical protein
METVVFSATTRRIHQRRTPEAVNADENCTWMNLLMRELEI